jgi:hypothetical protein
MYPVDYPTIRSTFFQPAMYPSEAPSDQVRDKMEYFLVMAAALMFATNSHGHVSILRSYLQISVNPSDAPTTSLQILRPTQPTKNATLQPTQNTLDLSASIDTNTSDNSAAGPVTCSLIIVAASLAVILII